MYISIAARPLTSGCWLSAISPECSSTSYSKLVAFLFFWLRFTGVRYRRRDRCTALSIQQFLYGGACTMPTLCATVGCSNICRRGSPFYFHRFLSNPRISKQWVSAMKTDKYSPSKRSVLCSPHFPEDMYEDKVRIMKKLGLAVTPRIIQGSVPTIFSHKRQPL